MYLNVFICGKNVLSTFFMENNITLTIMQANDGVTMVTEELYYIGNT